MLPGQATSYKVGQLELLRQRDALREELGQDFNPRAFHRLVLRRARSRSICCQGDEQPEAHQGGGQ